MRLRLIFKDISSNWSSYPEYQYIVQRRKWFFFWITIKNFPIFSNSYSYGYPQETASSKKVKNEALNFMKNYEAQILNEKFEKKKAKIKYEKWKKDQKIYIDTSKTKKDEKSGRLSLT